MAKFVVHITNWLPKERTVEADSEQEAVEIVGEELEEIINMDYVVLDAEEIEDEE